MSRLGAFEEEIVDRLKTATFGGTSAFKTVVGSSGGWRPTNRDALYREKMPAAYVGFTEEPCAPETRDTLRGARFVVLIATRTDRVGSNPRIGNASETGNFSLIDSARAVLDDHVFGDNFQLVCVHAKFIEADARTAVYELLYRVWPVVESPGASLLMFKGETLVGTQSRMEMEMGPLGVDNAEYTYHGVSCAYTLKLSLTTRLLIWRGELRANSHSALNDIEADIEGYVASGASGDVEEVGVRTVTDYKVIGYYRRGGRRLDGTVVVQPGEVVFQSV